MLSPEFRILLLSLRLDDSDAAAYEAGRIIEKSSPDWEQLYRRAEQHSIKPQLAQLIHRMSSAHVPAALREKLDISYRNNLYDQIRFADEFFTVRDLLRGAGVTIIPFKGFWLAHEAYGNIADRESLDVDVFVNADGLAVIKDLMLKAGYVEEDTYRRLDIEEIKKDFQEYNFDRQEEDKNVFHIEFHWGICPPGYGMNIRFDDLSGQVTRGTFQGRELEVFTPVAQLLLSLLHHGGKDRFVLLKQVYDVALLVRSCKETDWDWLVEELRLYNADSLIYIAVYLASVVTGIEVPPEIRERVESTRIRRLARNRLRLMSHGPQSYHTTWFNISNWLFRLRTRTGLRSGITLTAATAKAVFLKKMAKS